MPSETQVVVLTPPGRSAVASVLLVGPAAIKLANQLFQPAGQRSLGEQPIGRIAFGRWPSSTAGEEIVACRVAENRIEIHCHGGRAAVQAIVASLIAQGCRETDWTDWIRQESLDPLTADARIALAGAQTERVALHLWQQHVGVLRRAIDEVLASIKNDPPTVAIGQLDELIDWSPLGLHLTTPWRVVLTGQPNVGKSSLLNALVGYQRAIVHATPGTTRDVVTATTALDGWPVELSDTAGLRSASEMLEGQGIELAHQRLAEADLVVLVIDPTQPWSAACEALRRDWPEALVVRNKCDLPAMPGESFPPGLSVSAIEGSGLEVLVTEIVRLLVPRMPEVNQPLPFLRSHLEALNAAREALNRGDKSAALLAMNAFASS